MDSIQTLLGVVHIMNIYFFNKPPNHFATKSVPWIQYKLYTLRTSLTWSLTYHEQSKVEILFFNKPPNHFATKSVPWIQYKLYTLRTSLTWSLTYHEQSKVEILFFNKPPKPFCHKVCAMDSVQIVYLTDVTYLELDLS